MSRACRGVIFESVELIKSLIERGGTRTGLSVEVELQEKLYRTKRKVAEGSKEAMKIVFDEYLPRWGYRVIPS